MNKLAMNELAMNELAMNELAMNELAMNKLTINKLAMNGLGINKLAMNEIAIELELNEAAMKINNEETSWAYLVLCTTIDLLIVLLFHHLFME